MSSTDWIAPRCQARGIKRAAAPKGTKAAAAASTNKRAKDSHGKVAKALLSTCMSLRDKVACRMISQPVVSQPDTLTKGLQLVSLNTVMIPASTSCTNPSGQRPHQLIGEGWALALWASGANGILADDMGLGKTIQVIAFLAKLLQNR